MRQLSFEVTYFNNRKINHGIYNPKNVESPDSILSYCDALAMLERFKEDIKGKRIKRLRVVLQASDRKGRYKTRRLTGRTVADLDKELHLFVEECNTMITEKEYNS